MQTATEPRGWTSIEELCDRDLGSRPSAAVLLILKPLEHERQQVRDFIARTFQLMEFSRFDVKDLSPMIRSRGDLLPLKRGPGQSDRSMDVSHLAQLGVLNARNPSGIGQIRARLGG